MECPRCGSEYRPDITECAECRVALVDSLALPATDANPTSPREVVFASSRQDRIAVAKSILQSAGIHFAVHDEAVQDLFGWGRFPAGINLFIGPIRLFVDSADAADARELLGNLDTTNDRDDASADPDAQDECESRRSFWHLARSTRKLVAGVLLAYLAGGIALMIIDRLASQ